MLLIDQQRKSTMSCWEKKYAYRHLGLVSHILACQTRQYEDPEKDETEWCNQIVLFKELRMSTNIFRLVNLQRKFPTDTYLFQNMAVNVCKHVINMSGNCVIRAGLELCL